jgi:hypothetical protein
MYIVYYITATKTDARGNGNNTPGYAEVYLKLVDI